MEAGRRALVGAGERGLEREREVSSDNGAISAVDSIAYSDLSPRLREGEEGLIRFGFVFRGEGMNCHVIDCMLGPLVNEPHAILVAPNGSESWCIVAQQRTMHKIYMLSTKKKHKTTRAYF